MIVHPSAGDELAFALCGSLGRFWLLPLAALLCAGCRGRHPAPDPAVAGGVPNGIRLESVAERAGLTYRWPRGPRPMTIRDAFGTGCAFLDFDGDGNQDVLLVAAPHPVLYRNTGGGRFREITAEAGLDQVRGAWNGCAVGDYDDDGLPDLLLTGFHRLALLRNNGGASFVDITRNAGLDPGNHGHWASGAGFMDLAGAGRLDLVLLNYLRFGPTDRKFCEPKAGIRAGCPPRYYLPEFPELWENRGGHFRDATAGSGFKQLTGTAQVLAFADIDDDGRQDFYVGNAGSPSDLMHNEGGLHFRNAGIESGVAYGADGGAIAAMSADWADFDGDGRLDLFVTAFSGEPYSLLRGRGSGTFEHVAAKTGLRESTTTPLGFGSKWLDVDNDGWPDLVVANGHVYDRAGEIYPGTSFRQPLMLFHNEGGTRFRDLVPLLGGDVARPLMGRGLATGDIDNDGRTDTLVVDFEGPPVLLHNVTASPGHWLTLDLHSPRFNRFAYGARVEGRAGDRRWIASVSPASSYLSSSDPRIHFGLGGVTRLDTLTVRWPDGRQQTLAGVVADRVLRIDEATERSAPDGGAAG